MKSVLLAAAAFLATPAAALTPTQFIVFGDSFLDAGNVQAAVGPLFTDPNLGYWQGRFSDGPTWIDHLSYAQFGQPSRASLLGGTNFAVGGARGSGDDPTPLGVIPGLSSQLGAFGQYLVQTGQPFDPDALYVINFGNNDVNYIQALADPTDPEFNPALIPAVQAAYVSNMVGAVVTLSGLGAKNILLAGVPNPTEPEGQLLQSLLTTGLNAAEPGLGGTNLLRLDYFSYFLGVAANPAAFGLRPDLNFTAPCLAVVAPSREPDCSGFLSFDGTHVTEQVQASLSIYVARQFGLAAIPEPSSWAMMIAGFAAAGAAVRRGRRKLEALT
jgi:phospholipase/lecithinase/hemolysin